MGPRGRVPPDWIHNRQGRPHRSGAKSIPAFDGRKGRLYTQSIEDKPHPEKHKPDGCHVEHLGRRKRTWSCREPTGPGGPGKSDPARARLSCP